MFKPAAAATPSPPSLSGLDRSLLMSSSSGSSSPTSSPASSPVSSPAHKIVFGTPSRTRVHDEARVRELEARFLSRLEPVALFTGSETASNAPTTSVSAPVVSVLNSDTTQPVQANNLPAVVNTNTPAATNPNADMAAFEMLGVVLPAPPTRTFAKPTDDRLIRKADKRAKQHRVCTTPPVDFTQYTHTAVSYVDQLLFNRCL